MGIRHKAKNNQSIVHIPEKPGNKENPKRVIHGFPWEGDIDKISSKYMEWGEGLMKEGGKGKGRVNKRGEN